MRDVVEYLSHSKIKTRQKLSYRDFITVAVMMKKNLILMITGFIFMIKK